MVITVCYLNCRSKQSFKNAKIEGASLGYFYIFRSQTAGQYNNMSECLLANDSSYPLANSLAPALMVGAIESMNKDWSLNGRRCVSVWQANARHRSAVSLKEFISEVDPSKESP